MRDITLGITFYHQFTSRAFATGIPTQLAGSPVISALEENNATPITAGISLSVDRATVTGLNEITVVATGANGFEAGKSYSLYISTGTVDSVSVVGEVVGQFTIAQSAAAVDLANGTDGLGALNTNISSRATPAQVNTEVLDVLNVDTFAEPGDEAPTATTTLVDKIAYLYKFLRNKLETTSTRVHVYNDAGTNKDHSSTISDDGTTFTRGEFGAGD